MSEAQLRRVVIGARPRRLHRRHPRRAARLQRPPASTSGRTPKGGPAPGGTCTNVGCIPSKALLQSSRELRARRASTSPTTASTSTGLTHRLAKMLGAQGHGRRSRTTTASCTCSRRTRSPSSTAAARSPEGGERGGYADRGAGRGETIVGEARHRRHRLERAPAAGRCRSTRRASSRQRRRAAHRRGAEEAGRDRRRRDRPRDGHRSGAAWAPR